MGEPIWGSQKERIVKAKKLFGTWFEILSKGVKINASKDVTKGGLISTVYEISKKSKVRIDLQSVPYSMTRNLDNFLVFISDEQYATVRRICKKKDCDVSLIGEVK